MPQTCFPATSVRCFHVWLVKSTPGPSDLFNLTPVHSDLGPVRSGLRRRLRSPRPALLCSLALGRRRIGHGRRSISSRERRGGREPDREPDGRQCRSAGRRVGRARGDRTPSTPSGPTLRRLGYSWSEVSTLPRCVQWLTSHCQHDARLTHWWNS